MIYINQRINILAYFHPFWHYTYFPSKQRHFLSHVFPTDFKALTQCEWPLFGTNFFGGLLTLPSFHSKPRDTHGNVAYLAYLISLMRFRQACLRNDFACIGFVCFGVNHFIAFRESSLFKKSEIDIQYIL